MSFRAKSNSKTIENPHKSPNYCRGQKIYFNPQLLTKRKVIINTSTSKQMYRFGKEKRFMNYAKPYDAFLYDLPSVKDNFTTSLGRGKKFDFFKNVLRGKTDNYYDIPREFDLSRKNTPQYSFGKGRDVCKKPELEIDTGTPGVGSYNLRKNFGDDALKFSIFGREWVNRKISPSNAFINPGPGQYEESLKTNSSGNYISSLYGNTWKIRFAGPKRFKYAVNNTPGPGTYQMKTMFNRTGFHYTSRYNSMIAKTMSDRPRKFYAPIRKTTTPGPGSYNVFSEFNGYTDEYKKCKCGRRLGHPPVTEGNDNCDNFGKTMTIDSNKKYKNLKINTEDSQSSSKVRNKSEKKKDIKYKTIS
jgi:hypothetical protein